MNTKLESALATMSNGESLTIGAVTLHASRDGLSAWASGPNLNGNYLHTDADEAARVEALLEAAPASIPGLWNLRPAIDDRGAEYGIVYRICEGSGALVAIAETESLAQTIIDAYNAQNAHRFVTE